MSVISFLQDLVRIDTTPGNEEQGIVRAAEEMRRLDFDEVTIDRYGNLIGRVGPAGGRNLVVDGHIDTVPIYTPEAWRHDPFGAEIADGHIYGRGTADMKAAVAASIYGGGELKRSAAPGLSGCVLVVVSIAEEMREGATLARTFQGREVDWCIIGEATGLAIAHAQRGRARIEVEVWGRGVHAAASSTGVNAVELMTGVLRRIKEVRSPEHPALGHRAINLIDIRSEPYPSISTIPDYCVARFDIRFLPGESRESLLSLMEGLLPPDGRGRVRVMPAVFTAYTGTHYELEDMALSWETPPSHELVAKARQATGARLDTYPFCTNGSYFAGERGIPTIGYGPGAATQAHTVDEAVPVTEVERAVHGYRAIIASVLGWPGGPAGAPAPG
jgi:putative selenium metabolism hydrolase